VVLWFGACSRIAPGEGPVDGVPIPPRDGQGRPSPPQRPIGGPGGDPGVADGLVSGRITAPEGSEYESVIVELFEAPARIVQRVRARVSGSYRILYSSGSVNCTELSVRFVAAEMTTPYVKHLGRCGRHVVDYEFPRDDYVRDGLEFPGRGWLPRGLGSSEARELGSQPDPRPVSAVSAPPSPTPHRTLRSR